MQETPYSCALTIAGSDSGGGAGIQADLKTFSALGVYGASVITAITAQNTVGVRAVHDVPTEIIAAQMDAVLEDFPIAAVKVGMLSSAEIIRVIADRLRRYTVPYVVLDTVMISTSGSPLLQDSAVSALIDELFPLASVVTPNLHEAARLLHRERIDDADEAANAILQLGARAVLLKGGHGNSNEIADVLLERDRPSPIHITHPRIPTRHTHGTGCSLSSAVAAYLARGNSLHEAVYESVHWLQQAITHAQPLGAGHGPVHHFWEVWPREQVRENNPDQAAKS